MTRWLLLGIGLILGEAVGAMTLEEGFQNPPHEARPHTWFHMMNGNISKEGITKDFEAIAGIGLAGVQMFDVGCDIPRGSMAFNSPEWMDMMLHAAKEAKRLGLEIVIPNCSGWSSSGGPWVTPEKGMKMLVCSSTRVQGGGERTISLPAADLGHGFYEDIALLAFPTPAAEIESLPVAKEHRESLGSPSRTCCTFEYDRPVAINGFGFRFDLDACWGAAGEYLVETSEDGKTWQPLRRGKLVIALHGHVENQQRYQALTEKVRSRYFRITIEGDQGRIAEVAPLSALRVSELEHRLLGSRFDWDPPESNSDPEGVVKGSSVIWLTERPDNQGKLVWRVPAGDWTVLRLGYSADGRRNHPASVTGEGLEIDKLDREAVQWHFEQYVGKLLRYVGRDFYGQEGYGIRGILVDSYEIGPQNWTRRLPEEFARRRGYRPERYYAALAGYIVDDLAVTERFFTDFRQTIGELFAEGYAGGLADKCHEYGIELSLEPYGSCPCDNYVYGRYADIPMGEFWSNGQHRQPDVGNARFIARLAHIWGRKTVATESFTATPGTAGRWQTTPYSIKHQGDCAFAAGVNRIIFHRFCHQPWTDDRYRPGMTMGKWGMHFDRTQTWWPLAEDFITYQSRCQWLLREGEFVADVLIYAGEGVPNECLNEDGTIGFSQELKIDPAYAADAISIDALRKSRVERGRLVTPGGLSYPLLVVPAAARLGEESRQLLTKFREQGLRIVRHGEEEAALKALGIAGDCHLAFPGGVWIHRRDGTRDWYFVATPNDEEREIVGDFRQRGRAVSLWDAETGKISAAEKVEERDGRTYVTIPMRPNGSMFVVFEQERREDQTGESRQAVRPVNKLSNIKAISLTFPGVGTTNLTKFVDWTKLENFDMRHFSGTATYEFEVEGEGILDLGKVRHFAQVTVDGGVEQRFWRPPFRFDLGKQGRHKVVVKVTNLWVNRLIGDDYLEPNVVWEDWTVKEIPAWVKNGQDSPTPRKTFTTRRHWVKTDPLDPSGILEPEQ